MITTVLAWIYITFLCWVWGRLTYTSFIALFKQQQPRSPHFSFVCLAGFASITVFSAILSIFMPLGGWVMQLILIFPVVLLFSGKFKTTSGSISLMNFYPPVLALFLSLLLMIITVSTWQIVHPDTLGYHSQTIQWIEEYKAVPGLVHLHDRYGYQGIWYVACAVFSFKFSGLNALTFINTTFLAWFLIYVLDLVNKYIRQNHFTGTMLALGLLAICTWNYTHLRLTAASASPDFIATILVLAVFILIFKKEKSILEWAGIISLCIFSITIKLSTLPLLIPAAYSFFKLLTIGRRPAIISLVFALLILFPFITRNIITTGYIVFPSPFPDIVNVDWKYDMGKTRLEKKYITAYARAHVEKDSKEIERVMSLRLAEWTPVWWRSLSLADKLILLFFVLSVAILIARIQFFLRSGYDTGIALITSLAGVLFWFLQAPDPRFGAGFLLTFPAIIALPFRHNLKQSLVKMFGTGLCLLFTILVLGYTVYRFQNFFSTNQFVEPAGIPETKSHTFYCGNIQFHIPPVNLPCGDIKVPCVYDSCYSFQPRGIKIEDGFKSNQ